MSYFPHHSWFARDSRLLSGGETAYLYKGFERHERDPSFSLSSRLKEKEGLYFRAPIGGLKKNPYQNDNKEEKGELKDDKKKKKKEKKKKPPTTKEIREQIEKMIALHAKMVEQETPVLYPLLTETKRKRKRKEDGLSVSSKRAIEKSGLPICYNNTGGSTSKCMLAGESGKVLQ